MTNPAPNSPQRPLAHALNIAAAILFVAFVVWFSVGRLTSADGWRAVGGYWRLFANGWLVTLGIAAASLVASTLLGLLLALARRTGFLPIRAFATVYVELIRGTPLLVQILILFYGVSDPSVSTTATSLGVLILSVFSGAYISEVIRAGIESVGSRSSIPPAPSASPAPRPTGYVIFPQALRQILPPLAGQFASLIKDSSLLSIIGISEFTFNAQQVTSFTYSTLESYLPLALGYLVLTLPISLWTRWLEGRSPL